MQSGFWSDMNSLCTFSILPVFFFFCFLHGFLLSFSSRKCWGCKLYTFLRPSSTPAVLHILYTLYILTRPTQKEVEFKKKKKTSLQSLWRRLLRVFPPSLFSSRARFGLWPARFEFIAALCNGGFTGVKRFVGFFFSFFVRFPAPRWAFPSEWTIFEPFDLISCSIISRYSFT